jgi:hypothetical protein
MRVWEKLLSLDQSIGYNREMVTEIYKTNSKCPANIEAKHHFIGDKRLEKHCKIGCGVRCLDEYFELEAVK